MKNDINRVSKVDSFLLEYSPTERKTAAEFLSKCLPFLQEDLCRHCTQILSDRIRNYGRVDDDESEPVNSASEDNCITCSVVNLESEDNCNRNSLVNLESENNCDTNSLPNWEPQDNCDTNSLGSWKDIPEVTTVGNHSEADPEGSTSGGLRLVSVETPTPPPCPSARMSWADMAAEEDEQEIEGGGRQQQQQVVVDVAAEEDEQEIEGGGRQQQQQVAIDVVGVTNLARELRVSNLTKEQREHYRFMNVKRVKDFICLEKIKGKICNILEGLELHTGVFSAAEQKRIVDLVFDLQEKGRRGELKERTYSAPKKWMKGKGRVTIQFGCCYNYATDKNGNPPGILPSGLVDPIPHLFKEIIRRLVKWHVLPPTCIPDSCIVNIYDEGDCIPPHIDNHDFLRPFCTVSFLSECNIVFGSNLRIVRAGEFAGSIAIPLPVGSVLVLNGNGADVAKHCVPAVPTKRISITFRRMDESKRPIGFVPEPDLQGIEPLSYGMDQTRMLISPICEGRTARREVRMETRSPPSIDTHSGPHHSTRSQRRPTYNRRQMGDR